MQDTISMKEGTHPLVILGWAMMLGVSVTFILLVLVPFYVMGVYLMSDSEIWSKNIDLAWHPYFAGSSEGLYARAAPIVALWFVLVVPLFGLLLIELLIGLRKRTGQATLIRLVLLLISGLTILAFLASGNKLMTWIMD